MDIRSLTAAQNYTGARPATQADPEHTGTTQGLQASFQDFAATLKHSEQMSQAAMVGQADPHALVQALAQTELAVETAVIVRNKVVEAYQEILRMPV
ncbi:MULTISPECIES: flagellar hook-basal body complex protein FliE [unclassified Ruegeria]|uniref:flagellar hook-basal body complex protein FliE n=1 Tax=unclassified Ruegeria TaxID=2625375 RepID=UPI0014915011|nr:MULTISPECIES: flagellar hook-basal body complex protein FliE [unclassified Ruegeria]NOD49341.1 flagellar hook-basal body complex protein FliE [Ruegeria sp. HKCCD5849]NOD53360.1 flagellar hook-basal body complex protein FliE [Ruegeria sp. HKCCD5851]NOD69684.1 flagellar hook-basal body complex protein FliE [Ruegeria sp. HKCCD7303]